MAEFRKVVSIVHAISLIEEIKIITPDRVVLEIAAKQISEYLRVMQRTCSLVPHMTLLTNDGLFFETREDRPRLSGSLLHVLEGLIRLHGGELVSSYGDLRYFRPAGWSVLGMPNFCCCRLERRSDPKIQAIVRRRRESLFTLSLIDPWPDTHRFSEIPCANLDVVESFMQDADRLLDEQIQIVEGLVLQTDRYGLIAARNAHEVEEILKGIMVGR